jgi:hypothetical protein
VEQLLLELQVDRDARGGVGLSEQCTSHMIQ